MELTESYFDTGELRLHMIEGPHNGPPLVLLHGATGSWKDWLPMLPMLVSHWHFYVPDLRGHGLSDRATNGVTGYHISAFVRDAVSLLRELAVEPAVLIGHSWGAMISLFTAMSIDYTAPNCLRAVVAEDPPVMIYRNPPELAPHLDYFGWALRMKHITKTYEAILTALRQMTATSPEPVPESNLPDWAENIFHLDSDFLRMIVNGSESVSGIDFECTFENIGCPLLLLQADSSRGGCLLDQDLKLIQAQLPTVQQVYFAGVGHDIHSEQPYEVAKVFEGFIEGLRI